MTLVDKMCIVKQFVKRIGKKEGKKKKKEDSIISEKLVHLKFIS